MLDIRCQERLDKALAFAESRGLTAQLQNQLDYLANYACRPDDPDRTRCILMHDSAPHSFYFNLDMRKESGSYETWMSGGLIYYGHSDIGSNMPQLSVRFGEAGEGWSVHT